jgi:dCMP deaminase
MPSIVAIAYIPVIHKGYVEFLRFCEARGVTELYLIGDALLEAEVELDYINRKDRLRALSIELLQKTLAVATHMKVKELSPQHIKAIQQAHCELVTPKEDIGLIVCASYFATHEVEEVPIFLRWNKDNVDVAKEPDAQARPMTEFQQVIVNLMHTHALESFDWWRQVGAVLLQGEQIVCVTHNEHMPEAQTPNIEGDVRSLFKKGIHINYGTAAHAEVVAIGSSAKAGIVTEGATLYVTDFPCPYCARLIVQAGIKTIYFTKGYAVIDEDTLLKDSGVELIKLAV